MGITLKKLIELYILQRNYHRYLENKDRYFFYQDDYETFTAEYSAIMEKYQVERTFAFAAPLARHLQSMPDQPEIPFVLFRPAIATAENPQPLIIHTHGGPRIWMKPNTLHAEIAYYVSQGFVVACPNYRGSDSTYIAEHFPEHAETWHYWMKNSVGKHHILGPEDVYAVTLWMRDQPFIKKGKIILRGGSFGTHINSHLLAAIQQGKFEKIYSGAHLSGGVKFPAPQEMPTDMPLLIMHSINDTIAPYFDALMFMEKMLLAQTHALAQGQSKNRVQTFVALWGDHHFIDSDLKLGDVDSPTYAWLKKYLELSTEFVENIAIDRQQPIPTPLEQLRALTSNTRTQISAYTHVMQYFSTLEQKYENRVPAVEAKPLSNEPTKLLTPTMAHLKLMLGNQFTENTRKDLTEFLTHHFKPILIETREILSDAGQQILRDEAFMQQTLNIIQKEEDFLREHPDYMVLYHAAEYHAAQVYCMITCWKKLLRGDFHSANEAITEMRFFDFMMFTFDSVELFVKKMQAAREMQLNYTPGYSDRATAYNPALTINCHSDASCTYWWYFIANMSKENIRTPVDTIINQILTVLGLKTPARAERYKQLFERNYHTLQRFDKGQALLQQIFLPYEMADKLSYVCQIWGEEFKPNPFQLHIPSNTVRCFRENPLALEASLQRYPTIFTNYGDCPGFDGDGFKYSNLLQVRYLYRPDPAVKIQSYFRQERVQQEFMRTLTMIIKEDFADYLVTGMAIPHGVVMGAEAIRVNMRTALNIHTPSEIPTEALYLHQEELAKGLVQNPRKEFYGDILTASPHEKIKIQTRLNSHSFFTHHRIQLYAVCIYLKGYTYYDLLKEAAENKILNKEDRHFLMDHVEKLASLDKVQQIYLLENDYQRLVSLIRDIERYSYVKIKHTFFRSRGEAELFHDELKKAIAVFQKHALLAKEVSYGNNISRELYRAFN